MQTTEFDAHAYATVVARYGLDGAEPPPHAGSGTWPLILATLAEEKVLGLACAAATDGWLGLDDDEFAALVERQRHAMAWCLDLERRLLQIANAFDCAGVDFVVLKGPALAHAVYPEPSWRIFNDLDLLVRTSKWRVAVGVLEEEFGWKRRLPEPRAGFDERFGKAAVFTTEMGQQIDLHRTLAQGPFGVWMDAGDLFERAVTFEVGGTVLSRLDATAMFVHACVHAMLGDGRANLLQRRDVVEAGLRSFDRGALQNVAVTWRLGLVIRRAADCAALLDGGRIADSVGFLYANPRERRALSAYDPRLKALGELELATLSAIPGLSAKTRYIRDRLLPRGAFARARGWARWKTPIAWLTTKRKEGSRDAV